MKFATDNFLSYIKYEQNLELRFAEQPWQVLDCLIDPTKIFFWYILFLKGGVQPYFSKWVI